MNEYLVYKRTENCLNEFIVVEDHIREKEEKKNTNSFVFYWNIFFDEF